MGGQKQHRGVASKSKGVKRVARIEQAGASGGVTKRRGSASETTDQRADKRRRALRRFMAEKETNPAEWARAAGLSHANSLYNFLNGHSNSLSQETLEQLASVYPGTTISDLIGETRAATIVGNANSHTIVIRGRAMAGEFRTSFDIPLGEQEEISAPISSRDADAGAYGVVVRTPGIEQIYRDGTILVCIPFARYERPLESGKKVVMERIRGKLVEVTVRELNVVNGKAWLWPRSNDPEHQAPIEMPWPYDGKVWRLGDDRFSISSVVIGSYTAE